MAVPFRSIDDMLANESSAGSMTRCVSLTSAGVGSGATATGATSWQRYKQTFTVPTFTGNAYMTYFRVFGAGTATYIAAIETNMGTLSFATGTFTDGNAMPTRTIGGGTSSQLASSLNMFVANGTLTALGASASVTYTNQDGTGSRTSNGFVSFGSSATVNTAVNWSSALQGTDTGVQDVTAATKNAGLLSTATFYGLLPVGYALGGSLNNGIIDTLANPFEMYPIQSGDVIAFYASGAGATPVIASFQLLKEV